MGAYRLSHDAAAAPRARAKVEEELTSILSPPRLDDSRLLVTELVTNAFLHGHPEPDGGILLEIERDPGVVRIIVRDGGSHLDPYGLTFQTQSEGHLGLFVVDTLADRWGFSIDGDKGVWFEMKTG